MNREIKFRAWDNNKMIENYKCSTYGCCVNDEFYYSISGQSNVIFMQFTGLKDSTGADIYEGDIMQRDSHWAGKKTGEELATVFFKNGQFMLKWHKDKVETSLYNLLKGFFIIGNIYQNPELLESVQK